MNKREYYLSVLKRIDGMLSFAETKISFMLAYLAVLLAALSNQAGDIKYVWQEASGGVIAMTISLLVLVLVVLFFVLLHMGRVLLPRMEFSSRKSSIYFFDISRLPESDYLAAMSEIKENDIETDLLSQIHAISSVTTDKFKNIRRATYFLGLLTILWLALTIEIVIFSA